MRSIADGQISSIARRSLKEDKLLQSHLPHLEDGIRNAGVAASLWPEAEGQLRLEDPEHPPRQRVVTAWGLIRATWRGRGFTVFVGQSGGEQRLPSDFR